ncbi:hypothetical protein GQ42DRAFT_168682 [Ramicandelaber brevisporus]|nr:hypothetical protein GQ42DRAFT_168682 [Ramicandelaber brevisporus]
MNISKLLNPMPTKRPRFDDGNSSSYYGHPFWLPTEIIAYIISFLSDSTHPNFRLVSQSWYTAYELYHRNRVFGHGIHVGRKKVTRRQVLNAFVKHGHRLRVMTTNTSFLRQMLEAEPNFAGLIPNTVRLSIAVVEGYSSRHWIGEFVAKLTKLRYFTVIEYGYYADEHLAAEMDKAVGGMPNFKHFETFGIDLDVTKFPGPNLKAIGSQMEHLELPVATAVPGTVTSSFEAFRNIKILGLMMISSIEILREVADMVSNPKNFPVMYQLYVFTEIDITRTPPIVNEEDGTLVTGLDLFEKICSIRRHPRFELNIGFTLGACSTTDDALIAKEREFVINLGKNHADVLMGLQLTHFTPVGDYDPLTTLFYESTPRLHRLAFMRLYVSPTAATAPKLIAAFNNEFLLPRLTFVSFYVDGSQLPEWKQGFKPVDPSRGTINHVIETEILDKVREENESTNGIIESDFLSED